MTVYTGEIFDDQGRYTVPYAAWKMASIAQTVRSRPNDQTIAGRLVRKGILSSLRSLKSLRPACRLP